MTQPPPVTWDNTPQQSDIDAVRALVHSTGVFTAEEVRIAGELVAEALYHNDGSYAFVFARLPQSRRLAGYTCFGGIPLTDRRYELYWGAVSPAMRGMNLGTELLLRSEQRIRNSGGRILYAEASGREEYAAARRFYEKNGFVECARIEDFYKLGDPKVIYAKRLMPAGSPRIGGAG